MARSTRDANLENRTQRAKLRAGRRYWRPIGKGLALGYRKGTHGGTWYLRRGLTSNRYAIQSIGLADDHRDADGIAVLTYFEAQDKVRSLGRLQVRGRSRYTVAEAMQDYLATLNPKAVASTKWTIEAHIKPKLGPRLLSELTTAELRQWHQGLAKAPPRSRGKERAIDADNPESLRRRKATANRILTVLKAALNRAYHDELAASDEAWRKVKPFAKADAPKIRYLAAAEAKRLINAADPEFRPLVRAALLTGARYGELVSMTVGDYDDDGGTVHLRYTKSGEARHVPLTAEGQKFFARLSAGRAGDAPLFAKQDGTRWGKSHQCRPMREACSHAKITPPCSFHDLRNTYGALLAMRGVPIKVIAEALGHADTRITEKHYAHLSKGYVAETIRKHLPRFGGRTDNVVRLEKRRAT